MKWQNHAAAVGTVALWLAVGATGCATKTKPVYLNQQANFEAVRRVAFMPFQNFSSDPHAAEKVYQILSIELLRAGAFEIVEPTDVGPALAAAKVENIATVSKEQMKIIGDKLQAGGLWFGAVQDMSIDRSSGVASPTVILQFELVDPQTGATIWSTVVSREGLGFGSRLFGVGTESTNKVVQDLVREALNSLIQ